MSKKIIDLYFDLKIKDSLVDFLLTLEVQDFYFFTCSKYSTSSMLSDVSEQVTGKKQYGVFRFFLDTDEVAILTHEIKLNKKYSEIKIYISDISEI